MFPLKAAWRHQAGGWWGREYHSMQGQGISVEFSQRRSMAHG